MLDEETHHVSLGFCTSLEPFFDYFVAESNCNFSFIQRYKDKIQTHAMKRPSPTGSVVLGRSSETGHV